MLGIVSVTMRFYELIKCIHIHHFQLSKVSIHKQRVPIKRDLLILNVVNVLRFQSTYYSYFETLQLFSYNFQQQSTLQTVDLPMKFSKLQLHPFIIKVFTLGINWLLRKCLGDVGRWILYLLNQIQRLLIHYDCIWHQSKKLWEFYNERISIEIECFFKVLFILHRMFFEHFSENQFEYKKDGVRGAEI